MKTALAHDKTVWSAVWFGDITQARACEDAKASFGEEVRLASIRAQSSAAQCPVEQ
ncbi:MAG: hypothetical protein AAB899_02715 [Patescibacteria group bacterium]